MLIDHVRWARGFAEVVQPLRIRTTTGDYVEVQCAAALRAAIGDAMWRIHDRVDKSPYTAAILTPLTTASTFMAIESLRSLAEPVADVLVTFGLVIALDIFYDVDDGRVRNQVLDRRIQREKKAAVDRLAQLLDEVRARAAFRHRPPMSAEQEDRREQIYLDYVRLHEEGLSQSDARAALQERHSLFSEDATRMAIDRGGKIHRDRDALHRAATRKKY